MTLPPCTTHENIHNHVLRNDSDGPKTSICTRCMLHIEYVADTLMVRQDGELEAVRYIPFDRPCPVQDEDEDEPPMHHEIVAKQSNQFAGAIDLHCKNCDIKATLGRHIYHHH